MSDNYTHKDAIVLQKMLERIERLLLYCKGKSFIDFESDIMLQEACVFNILQIGELSKRGLSDELKQAHAQFPWKQLNGLRNRIVHGYEGVLINIVWDTIVDDFPSLLPLLHELINTITKLSD